MMKYASVVIQAMESAAEDISNETGQDVRVPSLQLAGGCDNSLGFAAGFFNVDASTKIFHTEKDCTYTLIAVPSQQGYINSRDCGICFCFCINREKVLPLRMTEKVAFCFSAYLLTHRQEHSGSRTGLYNVSAYGNKRFFENVRRSLQRLDNS